MSPRQDKAQVERQHAAAVAANQHARAWIRTIPDAPVFYPSPQEFQDPMGYIQKIQREAAQFGMCRIVPPCLPATSAAKVGGGAERESVIATGIQVLLFSLPPVWCLGRQGATLVLNTSGCNSRREKKLTYK